MSAAGVSKLNAGRLLLLSGALVLAALVGCERDSDGPINPREGISPPASTGSAVLSDFFVTTPSITAGDRDTLVAYVVGLDGKPLSGADVLFSTSLGNFQNGRRTTISASGLDGVASVFMVTSLADTGQAVVEASLNGIVRRAAVSIAPRPGTGQPARVDVVVVRAAPQVVVADDGASYSTITARTTTIDGAAVPEVPVDFTTTAGFIVSPAITDSKGEAVTSLYSPASAATAKVTASADGVTDSVFVSFVAPSAAYILELSASPDAIRADGGVSFAVVSARLLDEDRHPVEGASVSFETDLGFIAGSATTDEDGLATANLHSGSQSGIATVTASFGDQVKTVEVAFTSYTEPTPFRLDLSASPATIPADGGDSKAQITAAVLNSKNNPMEGLMVEFETTMGKISASGVTDSEGQVSTVLYSSSEAGTATVTARVGSLTRTAQVAMVSLADFYNIEIVAAPTAIFADNGNSTSEISATLTTSGGNPIEGALLYFTTTAGKIKQSTLTDSTGTAAAVLSSGSTPGTATVRASFASTFYAETTVQMLPLDAPVFTMEVRADRSQVQVKGTGGVETAQITAMAYDVLGNPSPDGTSVTFTIIEAPGTDESLADAGFGPVSVMTLNGAAIVPFRAGTSSGTVVIRASAGNMASDVTPLTVAAGPPAKINLCAAELNVSYCYHEPNEVCGYVCDAYNNPVADGTAVFFRVDKGCVTSSAETRGEDFTDDNGNGRYDLGEEFVDRIQNGVYDARGVISAEWTDCGPGPFGIITVTAETAGGTVTGTMNFIASGCPSTVVFVSASPSAILADGESQSVLRFQVLDENGLYVVEGTPVYFSSDWGSIDPDTTYTRDGVHESVALSTLTSEVLTQDYSMPSSTADNGIGVVANVKAESNFASAQGSVTFTTGYSDLNQSKLEAPTPMGVSARAIVTAAMKDYHENPLGAHAVEFFCSDGLFSNGLNTVTAYTGVVGVANAVYFAPADTNTVVISIRDLDARGGNLGLNRVITVR
jgi:adhesin/invasin